MASNEILDLTPPAADHRLAYGSDPNQFGDLRLPKSEGPPGKLFPIVMNIHGGFWRAKYDLAHAGHLCAALTQEGIATWNVEYRRVGNEGGGWPGTFEDVVRAYRFLPQIAAPYKLDVRRVVIMGHSAGGQLALCLAAHEPSAERVVSLAGVIDLVRAFELHLSSNAVVEFLGGKPAEVADHYREADPMQLSIGKARQILIHGTDDDVVPVDFSQRYMEAKEKRGEAVTLAQIGKAGHYDVIDPRSAAWKDVERSVRQLLEAEGGSHS
jgi:acetyl esterase/lipase